MGGLCRYIPPKGVCDSGVKRRGWGWNSGQIETPSGQIETPSGQLVPHLGKSDLKKNAITAFMLVD